MFYDTIIYVIYINTEVKLFLHPFLSHCSHFTYKFKIRKEFD